jgi:hypothetical protein
MAKDDALYLTDNGAALCGAHLGASARYTLRDTSGQLITEVTPAIAALNIEMGYGRTSCETCGKMAPLPPCWACLSLGRRCEGCKLEEEMAR